MKDLIQSLGLFLLFYAGHSIASEKQPESPVTIVNNPYMKTFEEIREIGRKRLREIEASRTMSELEKTRARKIAKDKTRAGEAAVVSLACRDYMLLSQH